MFWSARCSPGSRSSVLVTGLCALIYLLAVGWLVATQQTDLRVSADHDGTIPLWASWVPLVSILPLLGWCPITWNPWPKSRRLVLETVIMLGLGLLFPLLLAVIGVNDLSFTGLKLALLLILPLVIFRLLRRSPDELRQAPATRPAEGQVWPFIATVLWFVLTYFTSWKDLPPSPFGGQPVMLAGVLVVGFLLNALLEEVFYRVWLQTRLERLLGLWPAILVTSLTWSCWHVLLQGGQGWATDLATTVAHQGMQGLFVGLLWARSRRLAWPLSVHSALNAAPLLLPLF